MRNFRWLSVMALCTMGYAVHAQQTLDVVYLKDGTAYWGEIVKTEPEQKVYIQLVGGSTIAIDYKDIDRIVQDETKVEPKPEPKPKSTKKHPVKSTKEKNAYVFKEKGFYNIPTLGINFARTASRDVVGLGLQYSAGYQINRWLGLGAALGLDFYSLGGGERILPVMGEARGYFNKKKVSPYYAINGGYGFALLNKQDNITRAEGGWMIHPSFGFRLNGREGGVSTLVDFGYRFQKAHFYKDFEFNGDKEERVLTYQRLMVRMGIIF